MPDMDEPVNIDTDPEEALRLLLGTRPATGAETVEPVDEGSEDE